MKQIDCYVADIETYPNFFCVRFLHTVTLNMHRFEISDRMDQGRDLVNFLHDLARTGASMVGFNNVGFDYPLIHFILQGGGRADLIYQRAQAIINEMKNGFGYSSRVRAHEVLVPQIDLYLIHHFDNKARSTGLKMLEFNMRAESIEELPFPVGTVLTSEQMDVVHDYNFHDVWQTLRFYFETQAMIEFRIELSAKYGRDFMNHNDTKIGKDYFIMKLEEASPGSCYDDNRKPRQTHRPDGVALRDVIFPYIQFEHPEFQRVHAWLMAQTVADADGMFKDVSAVINGFSFDFGKGGIHGSVLGRTVESDDEWIVLDLDVTSYYPSLAIVNRLFPQHLGTLFCDIYADMKRQRTSFKKGSPENAMLKLALNGVYGDSGNEYSPFYDMQYLLSITINGQLLLCMLAEHIMRVPTLEMIQINTDGMTVRVRREHLPTIKHITDWWQAYTHLELEEATYESMFIRDVNNYLGIKAKAHETKRKGAYAWVRGPNLGIGEVAWHQNHSELIVARCAEAVLTEMEIEGETDVDAFIMRYLTNHTDLHDFMLRAKVPRASELVTDKGESLPHLVRFLVSRGGDVLFRLSPPVAGRRNGDYKQKSGISDYEYEQFNQTGVHDPRIHTKNKSTYQTRKVSESPVGYTVKVCNRLSQASFADIDYSYYAKQVRALVNGVRNQSSPAQRPTIPVSQ